MLRQLRIGVAVQEAVAQHNVRRGEVLHRDDELRGVEHEDFRHVPRARAVEDPEGVDLDAQAFLRSAAACVSGEQRASSREGGCTAASLHTGLARYRLQLG